MESIGPECTDLKKTYDDCFNRWYAEKFLRGQLDASPCQELFDEYKACLAIALAEKQLEGVIAEARARPPPFNDSDNKSRDAPGKKG